MTTADGALTTYKACAAEKLVGEFVLTSDDMLKSTALEASAVKNGVDPIRVPIEVMKFGACRMMQPPRVAQPAQLDPQDLGKVTIAGLKVPVTLNKSSANVYTTPSLPHPGFDEGAAITLQAAGAGLYGPLTLRGWGVAPLVLASDPLVVKDGQPVTLTWPAPAKAGPARVTINFTLNRHGNVDTWFECEVPDTGNFTIDSAAITALFTKDVSGFPSVTITRQSADSTTVKDGCVQFLVKTASVRAIQIPGYSWCHGDDAECPAGKKCADDLVCR